MRLRTMVGCHVALVAIGALALPGCTTSGPERWSVADVQAVSDVADALGAGVGDADHRTVDGSTAITSEGALAIITVTLASRNRTGLKTQVPDRFVANLESLGYTVNVDNDCIVPELDRIVCNGSYGEFSVTTNSITLRNYRAFFVDAAARLH